MNEMENEESTSSPANDASTPTYVNRSMRLVYFHVLLTIFKYRPPSVLVILASFMTKVTAMSTIVVLSLTMSRSNSLKLIQWLYLFMENCMEEFTARKPLFSGNFTKRLMRGKCRVHSLFSHF